MYKNRVEDSNVLNTHRAIAYAISEVALMIVFGALALLGYGASEAVSTPGQDIVALSEVRVALLMSMGFMVLSGYVVTLPLLYAFYNYRQPWIKRATLNAGLFLAHVAIFLYLVGSSPVGLIDLPLVLLGLVSVVLAEATASLFWARFARE